MPKRPKYKPRRSNEEILHLALKTNKAGKIRLRVVFQAGIHTKRTVGLLRRRTGYQFTEIHATQISFWVRSAGQAWEAMQGVAQFLEEKYGNEAGMEQGVGQPLSDVRDEEIHRG